MIDAVLRLNLLALIDSQINCFEIAMSTVLHLVVAVKKLIRISSSKHPKLEELKYERMITAYPKKEEAAPHRLVPQRPTNYYLI